MIEKIVRAGMSYLQNMPNDIIPLVNKAWEVSFVRVHTNIIAIVEKYS